MSSKTSTSSKPSPSNRPLAATGPSYYFPQGSAHPPPSPPSQPRRQSSDPAAAANLQPAPSTSSARPSTATGDGSPSWPSPPFAAAHRHGSDPLVPVRSASGPAPRTSPIGTSPVGTPSIVRRPLDDRPNLRSASHPVAPTHGPRSSSGNISSDDASSRLDMKRLLSKPAPHLSSNRSARLASDASDAAKSTASFASSAVATAKSETAHSKSSAPSTLGLGVKARSATSSIQAAVSPTNGTFGPSASSPRRRGTMTASSSSPAINEREVKSQSSLRHRASHGTVRPAFSASGSSRTAPAALSPRRTSFPHRLSLSNESPGSPKVAASRAGKAPAATPIDSSKTKASPAAHDPNLTPARAVMEAYKEQEKRRSTLALLAGDPSDMPFADRDRASSTSRDSTNAQPYYTVFGGDSGQVIAVGGPEDDRWRLETGKAHVDRPKSSKSGGSSGASAGGAGLRRSLSNKFKRATVGPAAGEAAKKKEPGFWEMLERREYVHTALPRPSLQERRIASVPQEAPIAKATEAAQRRERRKTLRVSVEGYAKPSVSQAEPGSSQPAQSGSAQGHGETSFLDPAPVRSNKLTKKRQEKEKEKDKDPTSPLPGGGKLWKLMKRMSTGGLRDKYYSSGSATPSPPPMPALPKDISGYKSSGGCSPASVSPSPSEPGPFARILSAKPSVHLRASPASASAAQRHPSGPRPSVSSAAKANSVGAPRRSTTTRSSSPISSSDVGSSSRFFRGTASSRSSTSSYGEEIPPLPKPPVGQHIIPPNELHRLNTNHAALAALEPRKRSPVVRKAIPREGTTPPPQSALDAPHPSLPFPPRRGNAGSREPSVGATSTSSRAHSPDIPAFSTNAAVNNFPTRRQSARERERMTPRDRSPGGAPQLPPLDLDSPDSSTLAPPPPRPARDPRRPPLSAVERQPSNFLLTSPVASGEPRSRSSERGRSDTISRSGSNASSSTAHGGSGGRVSRSQPRQRSSSVDPGSANAVSPVTFRELGASPRQARSEKEKADMWDDLLEKSARAGGTLHMGATELPSDQMEQFRLSSFTDLL